MRLDDEQRRAIQKAIKGVRGDVYLFGSRVDEAKKGGDVDLLVFSEEKPFKLSLEVSTRYFMECEEKVDVIVMNPLKLTKEQKAFLASMKMERIR